MKPPTRWVLLRGLARETGHWGTFLPRFRAAFPGVLVDTPDLPGCGVHHDQPAPSTVTELLAVVRARFGPRPATGDSGLWLLGLSLGSMVACEWRLRHPDEVAGLVLISASAGGASAPWCRLRPGGAVGLVRAALATDLERRERHVFGVTSGRPALAAEVVPEWVDLARRHPVAAANAARLLLAAARFALPRPVPPGPPTLVLLGKGDRLVHPACGRAVAGALGADLREHPTAGHDVPLDEPDWVVREVVRWMGLSR